MKLSGIDGVIVDWYGFEDFWDYGTVNASTPKLYEHVQKAGMVFAICYEDRSVKNMLDNGHLPANTRLEHRLQIMAYLQDNWVKDDAYLKITLRYILNIHFLIPTLSITVTLSAAVTIAAHYLRPPRPRLIYLFKPLTTILIVAVALLPRTFLRDPYAGGIALGLVFSLVGDIFLMLPGNYFIQGLVSFLIAHLWYWVAFFPSDPGIDILWPLLPLVVLGGSILRVLWPGLSKGLRSPVTIYVLVIIGMATLAVYRTIHTPSNAALSAAIGALLFLTSDALLALDRFRKPFHFARAAVLGTYFAGQLLIALSIPLSIPFTL